MKKETINLSRERRLVLLSIMDNEFCGKIMPILNTRSIQSIYASTVLDWVKEYHEQFGAAPGVSISDIFEVKRAYIEDSEVLETVGTFLKSLSDEYDPNDYQNSDYYVKEALQYIRDINLKSSVDKIESLRTAGKLEQAEAEYINFKRADIPLVTGVSIMRDLQVFVDAFNEESTEPLFALDGDLGKVVGPLCRGDFLATLSRQKGGKSWFLGYVDECAALAGHRVLKVNLEMRDTEMHQRMLRGILWSPMKDGTILMPHFRPDIEPGASVTKDTSYTVGFTPVERKAISFPDIKALEDMLAMKFHGGDLMTITLPSSSTTVKDVEALLDNLAMYSNYRPDVLTIDYCDLLGSKEKDYRQRLNDIWENLRRVAQQRNILVNTVTQTTRGGTDGEELDAKEISEDIRKLAHVSTFLALYGSEEDRQAGKSTIKCLDTRYKRETFDTALVLSNLDIGRWYIDSRLSSKVSG